MKTVSSDNKKVSLELHELIQKITGLKDKPIFNTECIIPAIDSSK